MRYFYNLADGVRERDTIGREFSTVEAARIEAVAFAGELLRFEPEMLWSKGQWRVEVTDERGALRWTVITLAIDAPGAEQQNGADDSATAGAAGPAPSAE